MRVAVTRGPVHVPPAHHRAVMYLGANATMRTIQNRCDYSSSMQDLAWALKVLHPTTMCPPQSTSGTLLSESPATLSSLLAFLRTEVRIPEILPASVNRSALLAIDADRSKQHYPRSYGQTVGFTKSSHCCFRARVWFRPWVITWLHPLCA